MKIITPKDIEEQERLKNNPPPRAKLDEIIVPAIMTAIILGLTAHFGGIVGMFFLLVFFFLVNLIYRIVKGHWLN
jgi:hypothetical protein